LNSIGSWPAGKQFPSTTTIFYQLIHSTAQLSEAFHDSYFLVKGWAAAVGLYKVQIPLLLTNTENSNCGCRFEAVIHFAGLKAVGESVQKPLLYYDNNLIGTITLLEVMAAHGCKKLVFSSSATVYGWPKEVPCTEEFPLCATNPYGRTKLVIEDICRDVHRSDPDWKIILLRYFNPVGAHPSGYIGEDPCGIPNNLMPYVQQVAVGRRPHLTVYGTDYNTKDGTGVRDYIHVVDLADGHIAALRKLYEDSDKIGCEVYNLGTGKGTSVLEMVAAFEKVSGKKIPLVFAGRRPGDAEIVYAATAKAEKELKWKAKYGIEEMCRDLWNWASKNPYGYAGSSENGN